MKAIKCEMCGSSEIIKKDGVYVCEHCGTKYSLEEAKKLLIQGVVKIDQTETANNYLTLAENAIKSKNYTDGEMFSNKAIEAKADEPKAWILKGKATAHLQRFEEAFNCFEKAIECSNDSNLLSIIHNDLKNDLLSSINWKIETYLRNPSENQSNILVSFAKTVVSFYSGFCNKHSLDEKEFNESVAEKLVQNSTRIYETNILKAYTKDKLPSESQILAFLDGAEGVLAILDYATMIEENANINQFAYETMIKILRKMITSGVNDEYQNKYKNRAMEIHARWNAIDSSHKVPKRSQSKGGCYIATAVYGTYDCPQVWILRRFRDQFLLRSSFGRLFVKMYYFVSPLLVKQFGESKWFKQACLIPVDFLVRKLRSEGISEAPYSDSEQ